MTYEQGHEERASHHVYVCWRRVMPAIGQTEPTGDGPVICPLWDADCDGWLEGSTLFLPADGQSGPNTCLQDGELPDVQDGWYEWASGKPAIHILGGLAVFA